MNFGENDLAVGDGLSVGFGLEDAVQPPVVARTLDENAALFSDLNNVGATLQGEDKVRFDGMLANSTDPDDDKARSAVTSYFAERYGKPVDEVSQFFTQYARDFSRSQLNEFADIPATALYSRIGAELKKDVEEREMMKASIASLYQSAIAGESDYLKAWQAGEQARRSNPGFRQERADAYRDLAKKAFNEFKPRAIALAPEIEAVSQYLKGTTKTGEKASIIDFGDQSKTDLLQNAIAALSALSTEEAEEVIGMASAISGATEQAGGLDKAGSRASESVGGMAENIAGFFKQRLTETPGSDRAAQGDKERRISYLLRQARAGTGRLKGSNWFSEGILASVESLPYMAASLTPAGIAVNLSANTQDMEQRLQDRGLSPEQAKKLSGSAAAPYTALDFVQAKMVLGGKLPGFEKFLKAPVTSSLGIGGKVATVGALEFAEQYSQEVAQDLTAPAVQQLASFFDKTIPGVDWISKDGVFAGVWNAAPETAAALLPLVLVGTGTATFREASFGREYLKRREYAEALGFSKKLSAEFAAAETPEAAQKLIVENWGERKTDTPTQKVAIATLNEEASAVQQSNLRVEKLEDGSFAIVDQSGATIDQTQTQEAAAQLLQDHQAAEDATLSQTIGDMKAYVEGFQEPGQSIEMVKGQKTLAEQKQEGLITAKEMRDAIRVAVELGNLESGATPETTQIAGENVASFDTKERIFKDVSRIYEGASPETLIEEHAEGYLKRRFADGSVTLQQVHQWREAVQEDVSFDRSERASIEWFSQQAQAYLLGKQMDPRVPKSFRAYLRKLKDYFARIMQAAAKLVEMERGGTLPEDFRVNLAQAVGLDRRYLENQQAITEPLAPAEFRGVQEGIPDAGIPDIELFNATQKIGNTPVGSTVSRKTIEAAGYKLPPRTFSLKNQTQTAAFKKWFGDSKVVDEKGDPLVVYHGTNQPIERFSKKRLGDATKSQSARLGFFFTSDAQVASLYAEHAATKIVASVEDFEKKQAELQSKVNRLEKRAIATGDWTSYESAMSEWEEFEIGAVREEPSGQNVIPVYLSIQNPKLVDFEGATLSKLEEGFGEFIRQAKKDGYDGLILRRLDDTPGKSLASDHYVVFKPTQIKSAIGNKGKFGVNNPDITFALVSKKQTEAIQAAYKERRVTERIANAEGPAASYGPEVAALVKDKMYAVRGLRAEHARVQEIMAKGNEYAERLLADPSSELHLMTRIGITMALSESYAQAKDYDRAAYMAEKAAELGTEAGQGINMFKMLGAMLDSPEKALAFFARQRNNAKKKVRDKREVEAATEEIEKALPDAKTAEELESSVIKRMRARGLDTPKQVRDAIKKLIELRDDGKLPTRKISDIIAEKYQIPDMTSEERTELARMAERVARLPQQSVYRADAVLEMMNFMNDRLKALSAFDKAWALWYGNILSGYNTHIRNVTGNAVELAATGFIDTLVRNPAEWATQITQALYGSKRGAATGFKEGYRHFKSGESVVGRTETDKFSAGGVLERHNFTGGRINPANYVKYVGRLLRAEDSVAFHTAYELKSFQAAADIADAEGLEGDAAQARVDQLLNLGDQQQKEFAERAESEWANLAPGDVKGTKEEFINRRVLELTQMERDAGLVERATDYANRVTFNYAPEGVLGILAGKIGDAYRNMGEMKPGESKVQNVISQIPLSIMRLIVPFTNVVANVTNRQLDYIIGVPRSFAKSQWVYQAGTGKRKEDKTADQRAIELKKGLVGVAGLTAIAVAAWPGDDDEERGWAIHGGGPSNPNARAVLSQTGWKPWSLQIGDTYIPFRYMPIGIGLASVAEMHDHARYKDESQQAALEKVMYGLSSVGAATLDASFLSNLSDFLGAVGQRDGDARAQALQRFVQRTVNAGSMVPFSNLVLNVTTDLDNFDRDRNGAYAYLASQVPVSQMRGEPAIDLFGDAIENRAFEAFIGRSKAEGPEDRLFRLLAEKEAWPTGIRQYQGKMTPEQFYEFSKVRGAILKQMIQRGESTLRATKDNEDAKELVQKWSAYATKQARAVVGYVEPK